MSIPDFPKVKRKKRRKVSTYTKLSNYTQTFHLREADFNGSLLNLTPGQKQRFLARLRRIYGEETARNYLPELERILKVYHAHKPTGMLASQPDFDPQERFTQEDVILISYGDLLHGKEHSPLATLAKFCDDYLEGSINTLHILPFFPYSSDRGFSVIDFTEVDPNLGSWEDIEALEGRYQLMFDGVINHVSSKSRWFQEFLNGAPYYRDFFITFRSPDEMSAEQQALIFRPRMSNILNKFYTVNGPVYVWTTFSKDQIDLKFENPDVLMRVIEILLFYVRHGADIIRLDAVTYLWAELGTSCIHLEETHEIVKLFRDVLDAVAPWVVLITETNVPHQDNISYFGNGHDEAQMVYNFALPPLVLHTIYSEDSSVLTDWAEKLIPPSNTTTFFNFLDSHDGIGLMAVKNILTLDQITAMVQRAEQYGGLVSYRSGPDGTEEPYEINITWFSALNREDNKKEDIAFQVKRFVASRIIALIIQGVPGIYLHSLIGTRNDIEAVMAGQSKRAINRSLISYSAIKKALNDPLSKISRINRELGRLISMRTQERAFHPNAGQRLLRLSPSVFAVLRTTVPEADEHILAMVSVTAQVCQLQIPIADLPFEHCTDLVSGMEWMAEDGFLTMTLQPYDVVWLKSVVKKRRVKK